MNAQTFRILALDGAGIKGAFTAAVLAAWEADTKQRIVDTRPGDYALDSSGDVAALAALGRGKAVEKATLEAVSTRFLNGIHAVRFQPVAAA